MHTLKQLFFSIIIATTFIHATHVLATSSSHAINAIEQHNCTELKRIIKNYKLLGILALFLPTTMQIDGTLLHKTVKLGFFDMTKTLVRHGFNVNAPDEHLRTPLFDALEYPLIAEFLLKNGARINARHEDGSTPLHYALTLDVHPDTPKLLIKNGADIYAKDNDGFTPLFWASVNRKNHAIVRMIVEIMFKDSVNFNTLSFSDREQLTKRIIEFQQDDGVNSLVVQGLLFALMQKKSAIPQNKKTISALFNVLFSDCFPQKKSPDTLPENRILIPAFNRAIKKFRQLPIYEQIVITPHLKKRLDQLKIVIDISDKSLTRDIQYLYNNFYKCINKNNKKVSLYDLTIRFKK